MRFAKLYVHTFCVHRQYSPICYVYIEHTTYIYIYTHVTLHCMSMDSYTQYIYTYIARYMYIDICLYHVSCQEL